jgi:hypothetical protein
MRPGPAPRSTLIALIVIVMGAFAWIAPAALAQVPGVLDPVTSPSGGDSSAASGTGAIDGIVNDATGGTTPSNPAGSDSGSGGIVDEIVDTVTNPSGGDPGIVDKVNNAVNNAVDHADEATGGAAGGAKNQIDKVTQGAAEGSPVGNPLGGFNGGSKSKGSGPHGGRTDVRHSTGGSPAHSQTSATAQGAFKAVQVDRLDAKHATQPLDREASVASSSAASSSSSTPILTQLAQAALEAGEKLAFPLALGLMVVAFLMVQGRIDRKDAKLVLAPIDAEQELLSFQ